MDLYMDLLCVAYDKTFLLSIAILCRRKLKILINVASLPDSNVFKSYLTGADTLAGFIITLYVLTVIWFIGVILKEISKLSYHGIHSDWVYDNPVCIDNDMIQQC